MNYTKEQVDNLLSIDPKWALVKKQKHIKKLFKKFNARTNTSTKANQIAEAERMMEVCAQAMLIYKSPAHKRNYTKKVAKKRSSSYKRKTPPLHKKTYDYNYKPKSSQKKDGPDGCIWIFLIIFLFTMCSG